MNTTSTFDTAGLDAVLAEKFAAIVGPENMSTDREDRQYFGQDAFWDGVPPAVILRPENRQHVMAIVNVCYDACISIVPRGGGMSYTKGYVPSRSGTVMLDLRRMNRILEINREDLYIVAEAGCTWQSIFEALKVVGLRTPYFGPMSGMFATVGGALSQNSMFYGSATYGTVAESVLGLEVVLADGRCVRTGAWANRGEKPFFRHYGPDLTGMFLSDTGALAVKTAASLRLIPAPAATEFASFAFDNFDDMVRAQAEIARAGLAAECFGLDPYLNGKRTMVKSLSAGLKTLKNVAAAAPSLGKGLKSAAEIALAGTGFMEDVNYSLHVTVDAPNIDGAAWKVAEVKRIASRTGREIEPTVPKVTRAIPFKHVGEFLVGNAGERWIPIHACIPYSKARAIYDATMAYFASKQDVLAQFSISTSHLTASSGMDLIFEPAFYYPDKLKAFHLRNLDREQVDRFAKQPEQAGASAAVTAMLADLAQIFLEHGAVHQQIGKFYPYKDSIDGVNWALLNAFKSAADPKRLMNPGSLGLE
jgi:D-lactate dehydrogenase (cytochrome)